MWGYNSTIFSKNYYRYNNDVLLYLGLTLTLRGDYIPANISEQNILITDINILQSNTEALLCLSELSHDEVGIGYWYNISTLHRV